LPTGPVRLRIAVKGRSYAFSYAGPGAKLVWKPLGTVETDSLTTKVASGFVGSVFGVFAGRGE
jgi:xylan 1,4-beta-xylosidase